MAFETTTRSTYRAPMKQKPPARLELPPLNATSRGRFFGETQSMRDFPGFRDGQPPPPDPASPAPDNLHLPPQGVRWDVAVFVIYSIAMANLFMFIHRGVIWGAAPQGGKKKKEKKRKKKEKNKREKKWKKEGKVEIMLLYITSWEWLIRFCPGHGGYIDATMFARLSVRMSRGVISTFSWGGQIFFYFSMPPDYWKIGKKQHFICSNLTLF